METTSARKHQNGNKIIKTPPKTAKLETMNI